MKIRLNMRLKLGFGVLLISVIIALSFACEGGGKGGNGGGPPTVTTADATSVGLTTATLNGNVNPNGLSTTYYFEYGTTESYGSTKTKANAGSGKTAISVSAELTGLSASTTYHFRLVATNSTRTSNGSDRTFTTQLSKDSTFEEISETEIFILSDGTEIEAAEDEVLIYLKEDVNDEQLSAISTKIEEMGATVVGSDQDLLTLQVRTTSELNFLEIFEDMEGVEDTSLNIVCEINQTNIEGYKKYLREKSLIDFRLKTVSHEILFYPDLGDGKWWIEKINAHKAWELTRGSERVVIGIVDTGLKAAQSIVDESRLQRFDYNGNAIFDDDTWDIKWGHHGLWVTGFAAGYKDDPDHYDDFSSGSNVRGVNHISNIIMVDVGKKKEVDEGFKMILTEVLRGIKTAIEKGADIVNVSIGAFTSDCEDENCKLARQKEFRKGNNSAVKLARKESVLLVFAAGNDAVKNDDVLFERQNQEMEAMWENYASIVGATSWFGDTILKDWDDSRMGAVVDILAPGDDISFSQDQADVITGSHIAKGTSFAAPLVTGAASLIKSINTTLLPPEVKHIIVSTAPEIVDTDGDTPSKHIDANAALESAYLTAGVELSTLETINFNIFRGVKTLDIDVEVPESGISSADILFLIDVTGSYWDDIDSLQSKAVEIIDALSRRGIDIQFGVAAFSDFPIWPYGNVWAGDKAYYLFQPIISENKAVISAIDNLDNPLRNGLDWPESQLEALYQAASGSGKDTNGDGDFEDQEDILPSNVGWREGSLKIIILATDAWFHDKATEPNYPGPTFDETIEKLQEKNILVIGLESDDTLGHLQRVVDATGGELFVLSYSSSDIAEKIAEAIEEIQSKVDISYNIIVGNDFINNISPDKYFEVEPGLEVSFEIKLVNPKNIGIFPQKYDIILWFKSNDSLIKRVNIPIKVWLF